MKRYTREEVLVESGARPEELVDLEAKRLLVPNRSTRWLFGSGEEYYTEQQLGVLQWILKTRRIIEARRHQTPIAASSPITT